MDLRRTVHTLNPLWGSGNGDGDTAQSMAWGWVFPFGVYGMGWFLFESFSSLVFFHYDVFFLG